MSLGVRRINCLLRDPTDDAGLGGRGLGGVCDGSSFCPFSLPPTLSLFLRLQSSPGPGCYLTSQQSEQVPETSLESSSDPGSSLCGGSKPGVRVRFPSGCGEYRLKHSTLCLGLALSSDGSR